MQTANLQSCQVPYQLINQSNRFYLRDVILARPLTVTGNEMESRGAANCYPGQQDNRINTYYYRTTYYILLKIVRQDKHNMKAQNNCLSLAVENFALYYLLCIKICLSNIASYLFRRLVVLSRSTCVSQNTIFGRYVGYDSIICKHHDRGKQTITNCVLLQIVTVYKRF